MGVDGCGWGGCGGSGNTVILARWWAEGWWAGGVRREGGPAVHAVVGWVGCVWVLSVAVVACDEEAANVHGVAAVHAIVEWVLGVRVVGVAVGADDE